MAVFLRHDGGKMAELPVHDRRYRNVAARFAMHQLIRQFGLFGQLRDLRQRNPLGAGAVVVEKPDLRRAGAPRHQQVLERHGAAQIRDSGIVLHAPQAFPGARKGFRCRAGKGSVAQVREQRGQLVGVAQARMHAQQFADGAIRQCPRTGFGGRATRRPGLRPGVDGAGEVPVPVMDQTQVGEDGHAPGGLGMVLQKALKGGEVARAVRRRRWALVLIKQPAQDCIFGRRGRAGRDQGFFQTGDAEQLDQRRARLGRGDHGLGIRTGQAGHRYHARQQQNASERNSAAEYFLGGMTVHGNALLGCPGIAPEPRFPYRQTI